MFKYSDHRSKISSGDLLAWSHRGWGSIHDFKIQMVRMFTRSEYSHVGMAWVVGGRVLVIEAVEPRARIYPLSKLGNFYHTPLEVNWTNNVEEAALNYVGTDYSQLQAILAYFKSLGKKSGRECAALVIAIADIAGIDLGNRATPDAVVLAAQRQFGPTYYVEGD